MWKNFQVLNLREKTGRLPAGWAYTPYQRKLSGNMPAVPGRKLGFHGGEGEGSSLGDYNGFVGQHSAVGLYAPNFFGLYDMHGNVTEHTADWFASFTSNAKTDPPPAMVPKEQKGEVPIHSRKWN